MSQPCGGQVAASKCEGMLVQNQSASHQHSMQVGGVGRLGACYCIVRQTDVKPASHAMHA